MSLYSELQEAKATFTRRMGVAKSPKIRSQIKIDYSREIADIKASYRQVVSGGVGAPTPTPSQEELLSEAEQTRLRRLSHAKSEKIIAQIEQTYQQKVASITSGTIAEQQRARQELEGKEIETYISPLSFVDYGKGEEAPQLSVKQRLAGAREGFISGRFWEIPTSIFSFKTTKDISKEPAPYIKWRGTEIAEGFEPMGYKPVTKGERYEYEKMLKPFSVTGYKTPEAETYAFGEKVSKEITGKYQKELDIKFAEIQKGVTAGTIKLPEAEKRLEKYQKETELKMQEEFKLEYPKQVLLTGAGKGYDFYPYKETEWGGRITTAGLIGGALFPPTQVVAGAVMFPLGASRFWSAMQEPTTFGKVKAGVSGLGGMFIGARISTGKLAREITSLKIKQLSEMQPSFKYGYKTQLTPKKFKIETAGYQKLIGAQKVTKAEFISEKVSKDFYRVSGEAQTFIKGYEFPTGKPLLFGAGQRFGGVTYGLPTLDKLSKTLTYGISKKSWEFGAKITGEKAFDYKANIKLYQTSLPKEHLIGGIAQREGEFIKSISGGVKKAVIIPKRFTGFQFGIEDIGLIKEITKAEPSAMFRTTGKQIFTKTTIAPPTTTLAKQITKGAIVTTPSKTFLGGLGAMPSFKTKLDTRTTAKGKQIYGLGLKGALISIPKTRQKYFTGFRGKGRLITAPTTETKQFIFQIGREAQKQKQIQKTKLKSLMHPSIITTPTITTIPIFDKGFVIPPFLLPKLPRLKAYRKKRKGRKPTRKTKYVPTITAVSLGITAPKIPKAYKIGLAGAVGGRPMIRKRKPIIKKKKRKPIIKRKKSKKKVKRGKK